MGFAVMKSGKGVPEAYFRHEQEATTFAKENNYDVIREVYSDDIFANYSYSSPSKAHLWEQRLLPSDKQDLHKLPFQQVSQLLKHFCSLLPQS